ncbi:MAG TPA: WXG100 family type VII secretion target [Anaerolineales bacterium]
MADIRINPGDVTKTGNDFMKMSEDVEGLVSRAKGIMSSLESQFTGARATKIYGQWHDMVPGLASAVNTLQSAGGLLSSAAEDFSTADSR